MLRLLHCYILIPLLESVTTFRSNLVRRSWKLMHAIYIFGGPQTSFIAQFPKLCTSAISSSHLIQAFNCLCLKVSKSSSTLTKSPDANSPRLGGRYGAPISEVRRSSIQNIHIQSVIKWATTYKQSPWTYQELVNGRSNNNNIQQQKLCTLSQPEHT